MRVSLQRVPNFCKAEFPKVPLIRGGEVGDAMMPKGGGESGIDDVTKSRVGFACPLPQRFGDRRFVIPEFPLRISTQLLAEGSRRCRRHRFVEDRRISKLHVNLNEHQPAQEKPIRSARILREETPRRGMFWRMWVGGVEEQIGVGGQYHWVSRPRCLMASASTQVRAGSFKKSPPQSRVGNSHSLGFVAVTGNLSTKCSAAFLITSDNDQSCCWAISFNRLYKGSGN